MALIKNYDALASSDERRVVLDLIEAGLEAIQPDKVMGENFLLTDDILKIQGKDIDLTKFENVYLLGFGKGSAKISGLIENVLGDKMTAGYVIDVVAEQFKKIEFTLGTHPLPSQQNIDFTKKVMDKFKTLDEKDLVLIVTCGGGSVLLEAPHTLALDKMIKVNKALLHSGATISEMNAVRKHLDSVKGGGLAKILFPACVYNLLFSDVPGNDLSVISSGPTVKDKTTEADALSILSKYNIKEELSLEIANFIESPKDDKYFENIHNVLILSNETALGAMKSKAEELGLSAKIVTDCFESDANDAGQKLIDMCEPGSILLVGGETSLKVTGGGDGGRNQQLVLAVLDKLDDNTIIASFDSDGWDNSEACGAIGDKLTMEHAKAKNLDLKKYLVENNSFAFFMDVGDAILTGRLPSNVSDLMIVSKL